MIDVGPGDRISHVSNPDVRRGNRANQRCHKRLNHTQTHRLQLIHHQLSRWMSRSGLELSIRGRWRHAGSKVQLRQDWRAETRRRRTGRMTSPLPGFRPGLSSFFQHLGWTTVLQRGRRRLSYRKCSSTRLTPSKERMFQSSLPAVLTGTASLINTCVTVTHYNHSSAEKLTNTTLSHFVNKRLVVLFLTSQQNATFSIRHLRQRSSTADREPSPCPTIIPAVPTDRKRDYQSAK